ncbi:hypothetical protein BDW59DRAFT_161332 [Aspergillus cavernicola]|uniref:Ankyrin repeat-containing domain protein n=1 Tax=Aspergillus cavernicola TaxID=176166 RepID=A0ABR4IDX7_9EURO
METIWTDARDGKLTESSLRKHLEKDPNLLNNADPAGITPLGHALKASKPSMVELLLKTGADPDKTSEGITPTYLAVIATSGSARMVQLLLEKYPKTLDTPIPSKNNETPLMAAVAVAQNPTLVTHLVVAGASRDKTNRDGKNAQDLADLVPDEKKKKQISNALVPALKGAGGLQAYISHFVLVVLSSFNALKHLGFIFSAAARFFLNLTSPPDNGLHPEQEEERIPEPGSAAEISKTLTEAVKGEGLDRFFPPGNTYIEEVAKKAALLKDDPNNLLNSPEQLRGLATLALYQPVLYCDDSGSMSDYGPWGNQEKRWLKQKELVTRITNITNRAVPDTKGVHLRLINTDIPDGNNLDSDAVARILNMEPNTHHSTPIGTKLQERILEPLIYSVINSGKKLERPYLILIITDGCPWMEKEDTFRNSIVQCSEFLVKNGYRKDAVRFCLNQIGTHEDAKEFLDSFETDRQVLEVLHRTAGHIDERYVELRENEKELEDWLLSMLLSPVKLLKAP